MLTVKWKSLKLKLKAGDPTAEKEISLEKGVRIVAAAATLKQRSQIVDLALLENGQIISDPMDLDFWKRSNSGQYLDGFKPIEYLGGSSLMARLSTNAPLAEDLEVEVVFGILKDDATCS